uniref:Uncharacterized protein n=1 Tax=Rhabditophanes sp. KR3021 TaxID=114890 RepID=A0AC35TY31_9BILA
MPTSGECVYSNFGHKMQPISKEFVIPINQIETLTLMIQDILDHYYFGKCLITTKIQFDGVGAGDTKIASTFSNKITTKAKNKHRGTKTNMKKRLISSFSTAHSRSLYSDKFSKTPSIATSVAKPFIKPCTAAQRTFSDHSNMIRLSHDDADVQAIFGFNIQTPSKDLTRSFSAIKFDTNGSAVGIGRR